ncbi:hypothetical protein HN51_019589 [Arachis hypogaea]
MKLSLEPSDRFRTEIKLQVAADNLSAKGEGVELKEEMEVKSRDIWIKHFNTIKEKEQEKIRSNNNFSSIIFFF